MIKQLLLLVLMLVGSVAFAQEYSIKGIVAEQQGKVLPYASVLLLQEKDSAIVASRTTSSQGLFILKDIKKGEYILKITFLGFAPYLKKISTPAKGNSLQLGRIELEPREIELEAVTILGEREVVLVKEDTVEYNAGSYNTRPNANVEALLKRLPGLQLQRNGEVRAEGETVSRIFIDGKEFFGGSLQMATRNLPADAIEKVQVIDGRSEEARFSGIDDGYREKVINLTLKEESKNIGFGKATLGGGTDNRYIGQGSYNLFEDNKQLSVMGLSNNINIQDLAGGGLGEGGGLPEGGGQPGLQTSHAGGAHLFRQLSPKTSIIASYQLNYTDVSLREELVRQNFQPGGTALYRENSRQQNRNSGHQATTTIEHKGDRNTLRLNTSVNFSDARTANTHTRQSFSVDDSLVNEGERSALAHNKNTSLLALMFYGHQFIKKGRVFTINNQLSVSRSHTDGLSESITGFSRGATEELRQQNDQENRNLSFSLRFAYSEPIGNKQYLQANYDIGNRRSKSDLEVYDILNETREFNDEQSNRFSTGYLNQQAGLTYRLNREKYNLTLSTSLQESTLSRRVQPSGAEESQSFRNLLPNATLNRQLNKATRLSLTYTTAMREPTINQLQPVISRFDPLNLYIGNPNLRPEYRHQGKLSLRSSDVFLPGVFLSTSLAFNYKNNPIVAAVDLDEQQVRTTQYVNVRHSNDFAAFFSLGIPLKKFNSQFNLSPYLRQGQSISLLNGVEGEIRQRSWGSDVDFAYNYKEFFDINLRANIMATRSAYELNEQQDQFFVNTAYSAELALQLLEDFWFKSDLYYSRFKNPQTNFEQAIPIFNFSLSHLILSDQQGEIKLSAHNVLNRNMGVRQFANLNYIEQSVQNSLGSYYMLSFTYHFNRQQAAGFE